MKKLILVLFSILLFTTPAMAHFGVFDAGWGHHMGYFGGFWMMLIPTIAVIVLVVLLIRGFQPRNESKNRSTDAQSILDERLARGEIDRKTYEDLKNTLNNNS